MIKTLESPLPCGKNVLTIYFRLSNSVEAYFTTLLNINLIKKKSYVGV